MRPLHPYAARTLDALRTRAPWETDFLQAVAEVFGAISPLLAESPRFEHAGILERLVEPERVISFRVPWIDDQDCVRVQRGYRVQFNSALGPYKGGLRFHASVDVGSLKFLGFEQTLKNALTGLPLGGGKGGADFLFRGRTDREMMRFCQSFMSELYRHIGPDTDVPAGDIGVGAREIGYLFGQYKRLRGAFDGALTGKGVAWGGSQLRPEATGFGVAYFAEQMLATRGESLAGKSVAISGFGNVAWGVVNKIDALGGRVVTLSGPDGFIHDPDGVRGEKIEFMLEMRMSGLDRIAAYAERFNVELHRGRRPWCVACDVAIPCAIQNELDADDAEALVRSGCMAVVEGANMPTTTDAVDRLQAAGILFAPGKASNAGGVAVSGLEMAQNKTGLSWTDEDVDARLRGIMANIHEICLRSAERFGRPGDYVTGANVGGFLRVAEAMLDQGVV